MKYFCFAILLFLTIARASSQIITVESHGGIDVPIESTSIILKQYFIYYPNEIFAKQRFTKDYYRLSKNELTSLLEENNFQFNEVRENIDTTTFKNTSKIKHIDTIYDYKLSKVDIKQILFLEKLLEPNNNLEIDLPQVKLSIGDEAVERLTQNIIESARVEATKIGTSIRRNVSEVYEIELMKKLPYSFPNKFAGEIPIALEHLKAKDTYEIAMVLKVSFSTVNKE